MEVTMFFNTMMQEAKESVDESERKKQHEWDMQYIEDMARNMKVNQEIFDFYLKRQESPPSRETSLPTSEGPWKRVSKFVCRLCNIYK